MFTYPGPFKRLRKFADIFSKSVASAFLFERSRTNSKLVCCSGVNAKPSYKRLHQATSCSQMSSRMSRAKTPMGLCYRSCGLVCRQRRSFSLKCIISRVCKILSTAQFQGKQNTHAHPASIAALMQNCSTHNVHTNMFQGTRSASTICIPRSR